MAAMAALELEGQLQLVDPQQREISLVAEGDTLAIGFPDLRSARHAHAAFAAQGGGNRVMRCSPRSACAMRCGRSCS